MRMRVSECHTIVRITGRIVLRMMRIGVRFIQLGGKSKQNRIRG